MAVDLGPKLGLLINANIGESYTDQFRSFLQAFDALLQASVINTTTTAPPSNPNNGDGYIITSTPSGAWSGYLGYLVVWSTEITQSGGNTKTPGWNFYKPNGGWIVWDTSTSTFFIFNGTSWVNLNTAIGTVPITQGGTGAVSASAARTNLGAAASGANSDITSLTAIGSAGISVEDGGTINLGGTSGANTTQIYPGYLQTSGQIGCGGINSSATVFSDFFQNATPNAVILIGHGGTGDTLNVGGNTNVTGTMTSTVVNAETVLQLDGVNSYGNNSNYQSLTWNYDLVAGTVPLTGYGYELRHVRSNTAIDDKLLLNVYNNDGSAAETAVSFDATGESTFSSAITTPGLNSGSAGITSSGPLVVNNASGITANGGNITSNETISAGKLAITNPVIDTSASSGSASALPATPTGYMEVSVTISGTPTTVKVPFYS